MSVSRVNTNMLEGVEYTNWQNTFSIVNSNSSTWGLGSDNQEVNSFVNTNSATLINTDSVVKNYSALWILSGINSYDETDPIFTSWAQTYSASYQSNYNTVNSNSAVNWNYQGTDIKVLTSDWQSTYSTVGLNSAAWIIDNDNQEVNSFVNTNSATLINTDSIVKNYSALWILSGGALESETDPLFTSWAQTYSANYQSNYTTVNINSSNWGLGSDNLEVNTFVNTNSAIILLVDTTVQSNSASWAGGSVSPDDANLIIGLSMFL